METAGPRIFSLYSDILGEQGNADVKAYIKAKLTRVWNDLNCDSLDEWPSEEDLTALAAQSGDLFVYVATVVRFIEHNVIRHPQRQLEFLLSDDRQTSPGKAFGDIDKLCLQIIKKVLPDDSPD